MKQTGVNLTGHDVLLSWLKKNEFTNLCQK